MVSKKEYMRLYRKNHPEYVISNRERTKLYYKEHPEVRKRGHDKWHPITNPKRMWFKNKSISLKENPRTGVCSLCRYQGKTHMHHTQYDKSDPLKHTIELCISCHGKESYRLGQFKW